MRTWIRPRTDGLGTRPLPRKSAAPRCELEERAFEAAAEQPMTRREELLWRFWIRVAPLCQNPRCSQGCRCWDRNAGQSAPCLRREGHRGRHRDQRNETWRG